LKTVTISLYNRPEYTARLLNALNQCHGVDEYYFSIFCEPDNIEVIKLAADFRREKTNVYVNSTRL